MRELYLSLLVELQPYFIKILLELYLEVNDLHHEFVELIGFSGLCDDEVAMLEVFLKTLIDVSGDADKEVEVVKGLHRNIPIEVTEEELNEHKVTP